MLFRSVLEASGLENFIEERDAQVADVASMQTQSSEDKHLVQEEMPVLKDIDSIASISSEPSDGIESVQNQVQQMKSQLEILQKALASASNAVVFDSSMSDLAKSS